MTKAFTLIEVVIVVTIMAIILSMTVLFGADYLKDLQLRREKELLINSINYTLSYVKSSNYYHGERFEYLDVSIGTTGILVTTDHGTGFEDGLPLIVSTLVVSGGSDQVRLIPYERSCTDLENGYDIVSFTLQSTRAANRFCFDRDMRLCKLFVVSCPE